MWFIYPYLFHSSFCAYWKYFLQSCVIVINSSGYNIHRKWVACDMLGPVTSRRSVLLRMGGRQWYAETILTVWSVPEALFRAEIAFHGDLNRFRADSSLHPANERRRYKITPYLISWERGVYWFHLARLSVCWHNRVRPVSSTILVGSISYMHIVSSKFRRCAPYKVCFKIQTFWQILIIL